MRPVDDDNLSQSTTGQGDESSGSEEPVNCGDVTEFLGAEGSPVPIVEEIVEHENANTNAVGTDIEREHQQKIRRWTLVLIGSLIAFCVAATLLVTALSSNDTEAQVAGDVAKLTVPTLLTLLGATVAWAYRRNGD